MSHLGEGADTVGLIHADMHLGNALFWRGEVKVIDFDDCGFGYWLYDIAVSLWELRHRNDYGHFRSALIDGYTRRRPLPPGLLPILRRPLSVPGHCGEGVPRAQARPDPR